MTTRVKDLKRMEKQALCMRMPTRGKRARNKNEESYAIKLWHAYNVARVETGFWKILHVQFSYRIKVMHKYGSSCCSDKRMKYFFFLSIYFLTIFAGDIYLYDRVGSKVCNKM